MKYSVRRISESLLYLCDLYIQSIQSLMLDDLKLKTDLNVLLSALGSNSTLTELDIRSHTIYCIISVIIIIVIVCPTLPCNTSGKSD